MFTGIVESIGEIVEIEIEGDNKIFTVESPLSNELKIDQSLAHNGVCLTVTEVSENRHKVIAIDETLRRSTFKNLKIGDKVNLERCMKADARFDGHIVQGHVDTAALCTEIKDEKGSKLMRFQLPEKTNLMVEKGSITINGISLTIIEEDGVSVQIGIIPYTFEHTTMRKLKVGDAVNIEFDIVGKYVQKMVEK